MQNLHPVIDALLFELDNVVDEGLESIPDDLVYQCQLALFIWSIDGREDSDFPPSELEDHATADRLMDKITQVHLQLGGSELDRAGFVRDMFRLDDRWLVVAEQYYSFIEYYNNPHISSIMHKLFQWVVYPDEFMEDFAPMYHLERSYSGKFGYTYMLGRKTTPYRHESLINFGSDCPSYMQLKMLIIGDITGQVYLAAIASSEYSPNGIV